MALPTGAVSMSDLNAELGRSAGAPISFSEINVRKMALAETGPVSMNPMRGGSAFNEAAGGSVSDITVSGVSWRVHTFITGSSMFSVSDVGRVQSFFEYLVVAGGGSGGSSRNRGAGGGGAGGYRSSVVGEMSGGGSSAENVLDAVVGSYNITVGNGGGGVSGTSTYGNRGSNSSITRTSPSLSIISNRGGAGGRSDSGGAGAQVLNGGSGGGRGHNPADPVGQGTAGQGFRGGPINFDSGGRFRGTSGGGAGAQGGNSSSNNIAPGGAGVVSSITGVATFRAGGGGGTGTSNNIGSAGSVGGGGGGGSTGTPGVPNTGSGGGATFSGTSGAGGSGIVVIRYRIG